LLTTHGGSLRLFCCHVAAGHEETDALRTLRATEEILGLHVDTGSVSGTTASTPIPDEVAARVQAALVPPGPDASRSIRVTPRATA